MEWMSPSKASTTPERILYIEDNEADAMLLKYAFLEHDWSPALEVFDDPIQALERLRNGGESQRPDLVMIDLNLPKKNGHEILMEIRGDSQLKELRVFIVSTSDLSAKLDKCRPLADGVIRKPEVFKDIVPLIQSEWQKLD
jgi:CheY-like chemotaxis protein